MVITFHIVELSRTPSCLVLRNVKDIKINSEENTHMQCVLSGPTKLVILE